MLSDVGSKRNETFVDRQTLQYLCILPPRCFLLQRTYLYLDAVSIQLPDSKNAQPAEPVEGYNWHLLNVHASFFDPPV